MLLWVVRKEEGKDQRDSERERSVLCSALLHCSVPRSVAKGDNGEEITQHVRLAEQEQ